MGFLLTLSPRRLLLLLFLSSLHRLHLFFNLPFRVPRLTLFSRSRTDVVIVCLEQPTWIEGTRVKIPHRRGSKVIKLAIRYSHGCVLPRGKGRGGQWQLITAPHLAAFIGNWTIQAFIIIYFLPHPPPPRCESPKLIMQTSRTEWGCQWPQKLTPVNA